MRALNAVPDGRTDAVAASTTLPAFPPAEHNTTETVDLVTTRKYAAVSTIRTVHDAVDAVDPSTNVHESLAAGCSMSRIDDDHLTVIDAVGHGSEREHVVGQRFPIDPPFGLVAMAWRDDAAVDQWLRGVTACRHKAVGLL
jgi:hypothetical protein